LTDDANSDGKVDVVDLGILAAHYGQGSTNLTSFNDDCNKAFGTTVADDAAEDTNSSVCSGLGLSLIAGLVLMSLMFVKPEE
jgi:hypothetical protein